MTGYFLIGAGVAFALLAAGLWIQTARLDSALEAKAALEVVVEDQGRKIAAQNAAVETLEREGILALEAAALALEAAAVEARFHRSRADALRPPTKAAKAATVPAPVRPGEVPIAAPALPGAERTATAAVLEIRKRLRP